MIPGFWFGHLRLWCHLMKWELKEEKNEMFNSVRTVVLGIPGGFVPDPPRIPKSTDAQVYYVKWRRAVGPQYPQILRLVKSVDMGPTDMEGRLYCALDIFMGRCPVGGWKVSWTLRRLIWIEVKIWKPLTYWSSPSMGVLRSPGVRAEKSGAKIHSFI